MIYALAVGTVANMLLMVLMFWSVVRVCNNQTRMLCNVHRAMVKLTEAVEKMQSKPATLDGFVPATPIAQAPQQRLNRFAQPFDAAQNVQEIEDAAKEIGISTEYLNLRPPAGVKIIGDAGNIPEM